MWHQEKSQEWNDGLGLILKPLEVPVIGLHGLRGSGKDTVAGYITHNFNYVKYAFADPLKEAVKVMFGFTDQQIEDRVAKEAEDPFWGFSPRFAITRLGTEYGRGMLREDVWLMAAQRKINHNFERLNRKTVISDVRFENEAELVRANKGVVIHIHPPIVEKRTDPIDSHQSEAGIEFKPGDMLIINDKSKGIADFYNEVLAKRLIY